MCLGTGFFFASCKNKSKIESETTTTQPQDTLPAPSNAPVIITADDSLKTGVRDATKDFPGVKADVENGEITLTGEIQRSQLSNLIQSLNSLKPKKINNKLTIK